MKRNNKCTPAALCCMTVLIFSVAGCYGGSRGLMRFDELKYPASMSSYLYGPRNEILAKDRDLIVIKRFRFEVYYPAIFYSLVPPLHTNDVGQQINTEVDKYGGDGVVNVKISSNPGLTTYLHPLTLLPFWPSYTTVVVEGDIVKYEPSSLQDVPKTAAFDITGDVLIAETSDELATVRLNEQCHVIGKMDTLFAIDFFLRWQTDERSWTTMRSADKADSEEKMTMQDRVKKVARERGANVAQILYVTLDQNEVQKRSKNAMAPLFYRGAALDIRFWSCPTNHSQ